MQQALILSVCTIFVVLIADMVGRASAQGLPDAKARCAKLLAYFDRHGAGRSEHSDGARNMTRIGAGIDCDRGRYETGIRTMEELLKHKKLPIPPA
jgi:hypothetical protein